MERLTRGIWGAIPFPGTCNQFLRCSRDGSASLETCAAGTFFNGDHCVRAQDVECIAGKYFKRGNIR